MLAEITIRSKAKSADLSPDEAAEILIKQRVSDDYDLLISFPVLESIQSQDDFELALENLLLEDLGQKNQPRRFKKQRKAVKGKKEKKEKQEKKEKKEKPSKKKKKELKEKEKKEKELAKGTAQPSAGENVPVVVQTEVYSETTAVYGETAGTQASGQAKAAAGGADQLKAQREEFERLLQEIPSAEGRDKLEQWGRKAFGDVSAPATGSQQA